MRRSNRWTALLVFGLIGPPVGHGPAPAAEQVLEFMRVHVTRDALADVPLGDERYVPMPREAFDAAVDGLTRAAGPGSMVLPSCVEAARYDARLSPSGRLEGQVALDIGSETRSQLSLGGLAVSRCTARTAAGVGDVMVSCRDDGDVVINTLGAGEYVATWTAAAPMVNTDGPSYVLPLVPSPRSTIRLQLPPGSRPLFTGQPLAPVQEGSAWVIEAGGRSKVEFHVWNVDRPPPALAVWSTYRVSGREVDVVAAFAPDSVWNGEPVVIEKDPSLHVTGAALAGVGEPGVSWSEAHDGRSITCTLPAAALGGRVPVVVRGVGPLPDGTVRPLPGLRPQTARWVCGGTMVSIDPELALAAISVQGGLAVTAESAARWPLPARSSHPGGDDGGDRVSPALVHIEHEGPNTEIRIAVMPRLPRPEVTRATVVDFAPGVVVGVATADVSVRRGEAFDLSAVVGAGWFIDAVDSLGWSQSGSRSESVTDPRHAEPLEWKVVRDGGADVLRVGLPAAVTPDRRLRVRVSGHRAGAVVGTTLSVAEADMVRFQGEAEGDAVVGFKTSAEQAVEVDHATAIDARLAPLANDPATRVWVPAGGNPTPRQIRLVRRRPPLDVLTQVRLTARDDRLSQSFTFECRPDTSDLDAIAVRFSQPMEDQIEWSLVTPATGGIVARRLESANETWLVEFSPPVREAVTVRAVRSVPFEAPIAFPLAWVEGAARQAGEVIVRDAGRRRPRIVNRRLAELPARSAGGDPWPTLLGAFAFSGLPDADGAKPQAELVPGDAADDDARAWAWRETTSCWCHESGRTEFQTVFEIESHGRSSIMLGLPSGRRLQGIEINGAPVAVMQHEDAASIPLDLPAGHSSFTLLVRSLAEADARGLWWRVAPIGAAVDLPVLDRRCRIFLPPALEIAAESGAWRAVDRRDSGVVGRLLHGAFARQLSRPVGSPDSVGEAVGTAWRQLDFLPATGRGDPAFMVVMPVRWIRLAAAAVAAVVCVAGLIASRRRPWLVSVVCVVAGVAALWSPMPWDVVARSGWWAAIGVAVVTLSRSFPVRSPAMVAAICIMTSSPAAAGEAVRVFIAPTEGGETALVPESLFRLLPRGSGVQTEPPRIIACRVVVPGRQAAATIDDRWQMTLDIEAMSAGALRLGPQIEAAEWIIESARVDGQPARMTGGPGSHDLAIASAGRHRLTIAVRPRVEARGDVEEVTAAIPPAPEATLEIGEAALRDPTGARARQCEAAAANGPFTPVAGRWSEGSEMLVHDVSRAARVRVIRPRTSAAVVAVAPSSAESRNAVVWDLDTCRVTASFVVDAGRAIVPPCIVRADPGLVPAGPPDSALDVVELDGNRFLVRAVSPAGGPFRFELAFRMQLANPVGVFDIPSAWIEDVPMDVRTTRFETVGELAAQVEVPASLGPLQSDEAAGPGVAAWRHEVRVRDSAPPGERQETTALSPGGARARVVVERRRQEVRGTQEIRVRFTADQASIALRARFDATAVPLVSLPVELPPDCIIDSIGLFDDGLGTAAAPGHAAVETHWSREGDDRGLLTVQRPRAGRFRLDVAGHVAKPPAATGRVPVIRTPLPATPAVLTWNETAGPESPDRTWELRSDERPPLYVLRPVVLPDAPAPVAEAQPRREQARGADPRVELADVEVTFEDRSRVWGRARFDVVARERSLRLVLPGGMRLFEVSVDGQPTATATPASGPSPEGQPDGERWDIQLHDVTWPRSIEVIYAGSVGRTAGDDGPVAIVAPALVGLSCARLLWTVRGPADGIVHVAEPGRVADAADCAREMDAARAAIRHDFERLIDAAQEPDRDRLRAGLEAMERRSEEKTRMLEDGHAGPPGSSVHVIATDVDAPLTVRIARRRDPTSFARACATTVILATGGVAWVVARRRHAPQPDPAQAHRGR